MNRSMRALLIAVFLISVLPSTSAYARSSGRNLFAGAGLFRSMATYKSSSVESTFNGWGASAVAGAGFDLGSFGTFIEAEYGRVESMNTLQSTTYMEKSLNTYLAGKLGFTYDMIGIGGGVQQNTIDIDNVTTLGTSGRTTYKGMNYFGFGRLTIEGGEAFKTILEAKYTTGTLAGLEFSETALSLRFVFLPF